MMQDNKLFGLLGQLKLSLPIYCTKVLHDVPDIWKYKFFSSLRLDIRDDQITKTIQDCFVYQTFYHAQCSVSG